MTTFFSSAWRGLTGSLNRRILGSRSRPCAGWLRNRQLASRGQRPDDASDHIGRAAEHARGHAIGSHRNCTDHRRARKRRARSADAARILDQAQQVDGRRGSGRQRRIRAARLRRCRAREDRAARFPTSGMSPISPASALIASPEKRWRPEPQDPWAGVTAPCAGHRRQDGCADRQLAWQHGGRARRQRGAGSHGNADGLGQLDRAERCRDRRDRRDCRPADGGGRTRWHLGCHDRQHRGCLSRRSCPAWPAHPATAAHR